MPELLSLLLERTALRRRAGEVCSHRMQDLSVSL